MYIDDLRQLEQSMRTPEMLDMSIDYLAENMKKFLRPGDKLMLCFTTNEPDDSMIEVAIAAVQAVLPEKEGEDRW